MPAPDISVVMSVYNGAGELPATLASVMHQAACDFEVIAIDDGSTDGSGGVLDAIAARDTRLRVIHQPNQGLTRALMRGCRESRGEFIARHDVGDISMPGRLAAQAAMLREHPAMVFVACRFALVGPAGEPLTDSALQKDQLTGGLTNRDGRKLPSPHHGSVMFRKSAYQRAGGYRSEFYFAQDVDLWSRLIEQGDLGYLPVILYQAKFDLTGITARNRAAQEGLRQLIGMASALRASGKSDSEVLQRAALIRPGGESGNPSAETDQRAAAAYFVGSCLARRKDPRGKAYLLQALRHNPLHMKSWYKLLYLSLNERVANPP